MSLESPTLALKSTLAIEDAARFGNPSTWMLAASALVQVLPVLAPLDRDDRLVAVVVAGLAGTGLYLGAIASLHVWLRSVTGGRHPVSPAKSWLMMLIPIASIWWLFRWTGEIVRLENSLTGRNESDSAPALMLAGAGVSGFFLARLGGGSVETGLALAFAATAIQLSVVAWLIHRIARAVREHTSQARAAPSASAA